MYIQNTLRNVQSAAGRKINNNKSVIMVINKTKNCIKIEKLTVSSPFREHCHYSSIILTCSQYLNVLVNVYEHCLINNLRPIVNIPNCRQMFR